MKNFPRCFSQFSRHIIKPNFVAYFPNHFIRRYGNGEASRSGHGHEDKERAPSTAETFERVAQEKEKNKKVIQERAQKGVTSQTIDKAEDAFEEATIGESSDLETVKQRYKED